jgi:hypothetical protein
MILASKYEILLLMLVRTLQLQLHLPIFLIVFPANTIIFIEGMMTVVKFDVMEYIWKWY